MGVDPEPDPAEVEADEDDEEVRDEAAHRVPDPYEKYREESLDQRLAEEEPEETPRGAEDAESGELEWSEDDDVLVGESDDPDPGEGNQDDEDAEDAAIHVRKRI
jgi:hypothetical protein